jgi:hypothetical protein
MTAAARTRRLVKGRRVLKIETDEADLAYALVGYGLLDLNRADDLGALTLATERALQILCDASHRDDAIFDKVRLGLCMSALRRQSQQRKPARGLSTAAAARSRAED